MPPILSKARALSPAVHLPLSLLLVGLTTWALAGLQAAITAQEGGQYVRPYGIGFVLPVAAVTLLAGSRSGLGALLLSLLALAFFLMPPRLSLAVASPRDLAELVFLSSVGLLTVLGVDATRRNAEMAAEVGEAARALREAADQQKAFLRDVLLSVTDKKLRLCDTASELPACLAPDAEAVPVTSGSLKALRQGALAAARGRGFGEERCHDLVTAVGEAAMNAVVHGGGGGRGRVCAAPDGQTVQVWVEDAGTGITLENLPRATLEKGHSTAGSLGQGFWMMLKTADRIWLLTGKAGTTVVIEQDRTPPEPAWA